MAYLNPKQLKAQAARRIGESRPDPKQLILVYTCVIILLSLLVNGLNLYLDSQISGTGGLSGLGTRSLLETVQTLLSYFTMIFTPFWSAGMLAAVIAIVRRGDADPRNLKSGFKMRVVTYSLLELCITMLILMLCTYAACYIYMMTPLADPLVALMDSGELLTAAGELNYDAFTAELILSTCMPLLAILLVLFVTLYVFFLYSIRLALYLLVEGQPMGAMTAILASFKLMKGHRFQMFKLDLSYWWYYALSSLISVVAYLDVILPELGIHLPMGDTVSYFVALILSLACQLALNLWKKLDVDATYVLAYDAIAHPQDEYAENE